MEVREDWSMPAVGGQRRRGHEVGGTRPLVSEDGQQGGLEMPRSRIYSPTATTGSAFTIWAIVEGKPPTVLRPAKEMVRSCYEGEIALTMIRSGNQTSYSCLVTPCSPAYVADRRVPAQTSHSGRLPRSATKIGLSDQPLRLASQTDNSD
ncbi:hypothetical protein U1Q18_023566 [Sarracenia purpurea var. burkii]